jgi:hypothetical protein
MVDRNSIFAGRIIENVNSCLGVRPLSSFETSLSFPVSARRRLTLRSRMMVPEVSLMRMSDMIKNAPPCCCQSYVKGVSNKTYHYGDKPKVPSPSLCNGQKASDDWAHTRANSYHRS